jgi:hypothetical protein
MVAQVLAESEKVALGSPRETGYGAEPYLSMPSVSAAFRE